MRLMQSYLTKNPCFVANEEFDPKGIMIHSVCCPQPSAKVFVNNWNRATCTDKCVHAFVDATLKQDETDGAVYQTLPWRVKGKHSGGSADNDYIGIAMCEPTTLKYKSGTLFKLNGPKGKTVAALERVYESVVMLCAQLCEACGFDPMTDIISHKEGYDRGIASQRNDPNHLWNQLCMDHSMDSLRKDVAELMATRSAGVATLSDQRKEESVPEPVIEPEPPAPVVPDPVELPKEDETVVVKIDVPNLRIRRGPGTGDGCEPIGEYTGVGLFPLTEIQNGSDGKPAWGKLADGRGWISMAYAEVINR